MKLRNIATKGGKAINLAVLINDRRKLVIPNQEFEISDARTKELLKQKIDNKPIVELVKELKKDKED